VPSFAHVAPSGDYVVYDPLFFQAVARTPLSVYGLEHVERIGGGPSVEELGQSGPEATFHAAMTALMPYVLPFFFGAAGPLYKTAVRAPLSARDYLPVIPAAARAGGMTVGGQR
jgi:hypothetical protein